MYESRKIGEGCCVSSKLVMATEKNTLDSEPTFAQTVPAPDPTTKKQDESPPTDDTNRTGTVSSTLSVTVTACGNGSDVVFSRSNDNGQARATEFLKRSDRDKNSSYVYHDSTLRGDQAKRSNCGSQTLVPPGNFNGVGRLPPNTQSHAFRPPFKGKQASGQFLTLSNLKTSCVPQRRKVVTIIKTQIVVSGIREINIGNLREMENLIPWLN